MRTKWPQNSSSTILFKNFKLFYTREHFILSASLFLSPTKMLFLYRHLALSLIGSERIISLHLIVATTAYLPSNNQSRQTHPIKFGRAESSGSIIYTSSQLAENWYYACDAVDKFFLEDCSFSLETLRTLLKVSQDTQGSNCIGLNHSTISRHIKILQHWLLAGAMKLSDLNICCQRRKSKGRAPRLYRPIQLLQAIV